MKRITTMSALRSLALANAAIISNAGRYANASGNEMTVYTGANDPAINIMGAVQDFSQEGHQNRHFGFTLTNTAETARTARLFAGFNFSDNTTSPGQMVDGAFNDVNGDAGLSATPTSSASSIKQFMRYLLNNPMRVVLIRVKASTESQIDQEFEVRALDVFNKQGSYTLVPSQGITSGSFNAKISDLQTDGLQLDDVTEMLYSVQGKTTVTIQMYVGAILDQSAELRGKAAVAKQNIAYTR
jgi:hypothetical protein